MSTRTLLSLLCLTSVTALAQVSTTTVSLSFPGCTGPATVNYSVDVYRPAGAGPFGLVGVGHGFQNEKSNYEAFSRALAAKGVVVVVPQFPLLLALQCGASDHSRNADILWAAMQQEQGVSAIDAARVGLAGHSAGGLSAFLAASRHAVQALVLFDAVDNSGLGAAQTANVTAPTLFLAAEPSTCNSQNNSLPWFSDVQGLKGKLTVAGGSHCEPQDPLNSICTASCGGTTQQARQDLFKKYALAFFDRFLNGVTTPCLEATAQADALAGAVSGVDLQLGGCGAVDAGVTVDAGSIVDAGPQDAGVAADAGADDAGVTADAGAGDAGADDGGVTADAGTSFDAGADDAGSMVDAGAGDAGVGPDGGVDGEEPPPAGCGCGVSGAWAVFAALAVLVLRRRATRFAPRAGVPGEAQRYMGS